MRREKDLYIYNDPLNEESINLTPLIDVVFVVLIMFILVAPLVERDKVALASASVTKRESVGALHERSSINIHVYADNTIFINGVLVAVEELPRCLREVADKFPHLSPQLYHDKKACFGTYQQVKNAVESAGFESLDVMLLK